MEREGGKGGVIAPLCPVSVLRNIRATRVLATGIATPAARKAFTTILNSRSNPMACTRWRSVKGSVFRQAKMVKRMQ